MCVSDGMCNCKIYLCCCVDALYDRVLKLKSEKLNWGKLVMLTSFSSRCAREAWFDGRPSAVQTIVRLVQECYINLDDAITSLGGWVSELN